MGHDMPPRPLNLVRLLIWRVACCLRSKPEAVRDIVRDHRSCPALEKPVRRHEGVHLKEMRNEGVSYGAGCVRPGLVATCQG